MSTLLQAFVLLLVVWTLAYRRARMGSILTGVAVTLFAMTWFGGFAWLLWLTLVPVVYFYLKDNVRRDKLSRPVFTFFKRVLPPISDTEQEALEAGDTWWEADLFKGAPDWKKWLALPMPALSAAEESFLANQTETFCRMIDDWDIVHIDKDLQPAAWQYLKDEKFFGMIIPEEYGGLGFSALAHSTIVTKIATRSPSAAVTAMVPNSLGPAELLMKYGTEEQRQHYLPRLASGQDIPCFALTGPEAGSDAGAMTDTGIVCMGEFEGRQCLGLSVSWNKRYITLAPVATVLGLAFKMSDPNHLLSDVEDRGITVALIPTSHPGVQIGHRHFSMGMTFMNGPTRGENVFIPLEWIIGGVERAGQGWRMLARQIRRHHADCVVGHDLPELVGKRQPFRSQYPFHVLPAHSADLFVSAGKPAGFQHRQVFPEHSRPDLLQLNIRVLHDIEICIRTGDALGKARQHFSGAFRPDQFYLADDDGVFVSHQFQGHFHSQRVDYLDLHCADSAH